MEKTIITNSTGETRKIGAMLAKELKSGEIICLSGDLGAGKTTFAQGLLKGLKVKGPYTSPTFVIMKKYETNIYHFDAYRVGVKDILNLGWEEIIEDKNNVIIIEWAERIRRIIPKDALWIQIESIGEDKRKLIFKQKK